jgi:tRNA(fMet)-specific endonuclease VapC
MIYLLDTNTCIQYLRKKNPHVVRRIQAHSAADLRLCSVVVAELYYGAFKGPYQSANLGLLATFVPGFVSLSFDDAAAVEYGRIRVHLEAQGKPIGPYDMQIAAIALVNGCTVVTHNTGEFARVPGLAVEDWEVP